LLASLVAHTALYGGDHLVGGAYHSLLLELATVGTGAFVALLAALAWTGSRLTAQGSILSARMGSRLPGLAPLVASAGLWFALIERAESDHWGAGIFLTAVCLVAAAWSLLTLARGAARLLAGAVIAIFRAPSAARTPVWVRPELPRPFARRSPPLRRRFARPPPIANVRA
jgi:hypothetical protein